MHGTCRRLVAVLLFCAGPMPFASADEAYCQQLQAMGFQGKRVVIHSTAEGQGGNRVEGVIVEFRPSIVIVDLGEAQPFIQPLRDERGKIIEPKGRERAYVNCSHIFYIVGGAR